MKTPIDSGVGEGAASGGRVRDADVAAQETEAPSRQSVEDALTRLLDAILPDRKGSQAGSGATRSRRAGR